MFAPVARVNDFHLCPMQTPAVVPIPHVGGPVVGPGALTVWAGGMPVVMDRNQQVYVAGSRVEASVSARPTYCAWAR